MKNLLKTILFRAHAALLPKRHARILRRVATMTAATVREETRQLRDGYFELVLPTLDTAAREGLVDVFATVDDAYGELLDAAERGATFDQVANRIQEIDVTMRVALTRLMFN